ncbi:uncharacterized protein KIAA1958 homolog [Littorina saxatilis]|uniref:uncharacterized protein KIAA1958 homolog n=1 Tax=Littorina saxatilis TaxID=31220 RepID=UPI0038B62348
MDGDFDLISDFFLEDFNEEDENLMAAAPKKRRFEKVTDDDENALITDTENANTKRKTEHVIRLISDFILQTEEFAKQMRSADIAKIEDPKLVANILVKFLTTVKREDGDEYEPGTIRGFLSAVDRHMAANGKGKIFSSNDTLFENVRAVAKSKQKKLKSAGKGNLPQRACALTDEEVETLWDSGQLGVSTPRAIINTLWWLNCLHFGMRARTEHRQMCWSDVTVQMDSSGHRFLEFNERTTKTRTGVSRQDVRAKPRAYEDVENPERCPVKIFEKYASLRPAETCGSNYPFYLTCVHDPKPGKQWFRAMPMGVNTIGSLMKEMAAASEISSTTSKRISGTSARKTLLQKLNDSGVPPTHIMEKSGHKNIQSVLSYAKMSDNQQLQVSRILSTTRTCTVSKLGAMTSTTDDADSSASASGGNTLRQPAVTFDAPIHGGVFNFNFTMPQ